ncbi:hypothetical protein CW734_04540 [Planococcus sp. MB-3u-03]|nr:hypothetical protein CW734_04540 [Planococcus sp. MB-3u-03]
MWLRGLDGVDIILEKYKTYQRKVIDQASEMQRFITIKDELEALRTEIIQADYSRKLETRLNDMMQETFLISQYHCSVIRKKILPRSYILLYKLILIF